jgi:5-carboxymethyl-2-hydroxymuconate isomerase
MPHLSFEYSANLENQLDLKAFAEVLHTAALETELFPLAGIRVRGLRCETYLIADKNPEYSFIDLSVRLREGRPEDAKRLAIQAIFDAGSDYIKENLPNTPIAFSAEMRDINAELSPKMNTIRNYMSQPT